MIILDANILIGLFDPYDLKHALSEQLLIDHGNERLALSALTLTEFLIRPAAVGKAAQAEDFVTDMGIIVIPLLAQDARHIAQVRAVSGLKLPDAVVLWLAQSSVASVMTMDERLAKAALGMGVPVLPA